MCVRKKEHLEESYIFFAVICIFFGLTSASVDASEMGFVFAVSTRRRELVSEVGWVSERTRFKRSSRFMRARSYALRFIAPDVDSGQVLSYFFRWIPSELNCSDKGSRYSLR